MGRVRKRGPDRGPRKRYRGKIAGGKAEAAVKECLLNGGTLEEARRLVTRIDGKSPSKRSVSRYYHRLLEAAERTQTLDALARALSEKMNANGWRIGGVAREMILARALEAAAHLPEDAMRNLPADRLALLLCQLLRAAAEADRHEHWAYMCDALPGRRGQWEPGKRKSACQLPRDSALLRLMTQIGMPIKAGGGPGGTEEAAGGEPEEADGGADEDGEEEREAAEP